MLPFFRDRNSGWAILIIHILKEIKNNSYSCIVMSQKHYKFIICTFLSKYIQELERWLNC